MYLWLKLAHLFFVISWFAGLFYLPRIFVNLAQAAPDGAEYARLLEMARRLYRFMSPLGVGAVVCGWATAWSAGWAGAHWVWVKLAAGLFLLGYQFYCGALWRGFAARRNVKTHKWYRVFNEIPVLAMMLALYLVVFKPF